jgi:hypothetical protein
MSKTNDGTFSGGAAAPRVRVGQHPLAVGHWYPVM